MPRLAHGLWLVCACAWPVGGCARAVALDGPVDGSGPADAPRLDAFVQLDARAVDAADQHDAPRAIDARMIDAPPDALESSCTTPFTGTLASWSFSGQPGSQQSQAATSTATGVDAGLLARSAALTAVSGSSSINSSGWTTSSSRDGSEYYTLTLAPPSGCEMDLTGLSTDGKSSSTGPASAEASTSADSFGAEASVSTSGTSTPTLTVTDQTASVEIRIYGFSASSGEGTFRLEGTLSVTGSLH
jgi:hypothetical protein